MPTAVEKLAAFWRLLGANVETMTADHHDLVLAITSHLPHLIAYTIVGTADELQTVTRSEVLKFSAGGFRDFTRIAASDPTMWRDVFLANKDAVLEMLGRFNEDLSALTQAIRNGDGDALFEHFTRTRAIRSGIVEIGQDSPAPDFGRAASGPAARAAAEALRGDERLKQRRRRAERIGPSNTAPSSKRSGSVTARLAFERRRLAEHVDAGDDIGAGLLARHVAEPRHEAVERAGELVHRPASSAPSACAPSVRGTARGRRR